MDLWLNIYLAFAVAIFVWLSAFVRWNSSKMLTEVVPYSSDIELSATPRQVETIEPLQVEHSAEDFPVMKLIQFSFMLIPTTIVWYFADKVPVRDTEWYGMYYVSVGVYALYAAVLLFSDITKLAEYRSKRIFLMGAQAALQYQQAGKRKFASR